MGEDDDDTLRRKISLKPNKTEMERAEFREHIESRIRFRIGLREPVIVQMQVLPDISELVNIIFF